MALDGRKLRDNKPAGLENEIASTTLDAGELPTFAAFFDGKGLELLLEFRIRTEAGGAQPGGEAVGGRQICGQECNSGSEGREDSVNHSGGHWVVASGRGGV